MIQEVTGDILLSRAQVIAHGIAPDDGHNQGLALSLRQRWPAMYEDFRRHCQSTHPKPGSLWAWSGAEDKRIVALFILAAAYQHGVRPGRATREYLQQALTGLRTWLLAETCRSLALPRLASGMGGLEWGEVHALIDQHLGDLPMPVYLYTTFHSGEQADERA